MEYEINRDGREVILTLSGWADTSASQELEHSIQPLLQEKDVDIIVDCTNLEYVSSSGLRCFIALLKSSQANGNTLLIRGLNDMVREVFDMTGFSGIFNIE